MRRPLPLFVGLWFAGLAAVAQGSDAGCTPGSYRSANGDLAAIVQTPERVAYTFLRGGRGGLAAPDSPLICDGGEIKGRDGQAWTRIAFRSSTVDFTSRGTRLRGVLLLPNGENSKPSLVVLVHGSERASPNGSSLQQLLTAQGVATFAYDKRGTGQSRGVYTQDFLLLADDAAAAVRAARRACPRCFGRVGLHGGSQGGWIAPLAAVKSKADFVEVSYGLVGTALEQDQWQIDYQLRELGFEPAAAVHEVTAATARVAASDFTEHIEALSEIRRKYASEPWFDKLDGQYTGELMRGEVEKARSESPAVPWSYDGIAVLRRLEIPQLWVFAGEDSVAPSGPSVARLGRLRRDGVDASVVIFPRTDHGIATFVIDAAGQRRRTGVADGYYRLIADWAKGTLQPPYGEARWESTGRTP